MQYGRLRTVEKETMAMGYCSWVEAGLAAADQVLWRNTISGPKKNTENMTSRYFVFI